MTFKPPVTSGPKIAPSSASTRDYGKKSPVAIPGMPSNGYPS
jgi:hypothetical protein